MPTNPSVRIVWYATLNWLILIFLFGLTSTVAGEGAVAFVLTLAHLGIVPMITHHYLRKYEGDRMRGAWKIGIAMGAIGMALDFLTFGVYMGKGAAYFHERMPYAYLTLRVALAPITAKWIEPQMSQ